MAHYSQIEKHCECCDSRLILKNQRDVERKRFCSKTCHGTATGRLRMADPAFVTKFRAASVSSLSNAKKGHCGENHPRWKGGPVTVNCKWCRKPFEVARFRAEAKTAGKYCSKDCYLAHHAVGGQKKPRPILNCSVCGRPFRLRRLTEVNHRKPRAICSVRCVNIYRRVLLSQQRAVGTQIEKAVELMLVALGISYEKEKPLLGMTVADFFVPPNIAIYADGDYWHGLPQSKKRDFRINMCLVAAGYRVFRFTEAIIYSNPNRVKKELNNACIQ